MKQGPRYYIKPRRQREGKTDYRKRLKLLKSRTTRIVIRNSVRNIRVQFIEYSEGGDKILASAFSQELTNKYKWDFSTSTTPAAYLTGLLAAKRAKDNGVIKGIPDIGRQNPSTGSKVFAAIKGVIDLGIECPYNETKFPSDDRIMGKHLDDKIMIKVSDVKTKIIGGK